MAGAATEQDLAAWVPNWDMPQGQMTVFWIFGAAALLSILYAVYAARRRRSVSPILYIIGAALTCNLEPICCRMAEASHAQTGQLTAFVSEGRAIPWHIVFSYVVYFGPALIMLVPAFRARLFGPAKIWTIFFAMVVLAWLFEWPFMRMGYWGYFGGRHSLSFGYMPIYFSFTNVVAIFVPIALVARLEERLTGWRQALVALIIPSGALAGHFAVAWPMYNVMNSPAPDWATNLAAAVSVLLSIVAIRLMMPLISTEPARVARQTMTEQAAE